jgi:ketosteroid isomerase-like protein
MKRILITAVLTLIASLTVVGQTPEKKPAPTEDVEQIVLKLTNDWIEAELKRDGASLNRILADDFIATTPDGTKITKKMIVPDPKGKGGGLSFTGADFATRVFGDTAIVTGNGTWIPKEDGTLTFTVLFTKRQDRWQIVYVHISNVPKQ